MQAQTELMQTGVRGLADGDDEKEEEEEFFDAYQFVEELAKAEQATKAFCQKIVDDLGCYTTIGNEDVNQYVFNVTEVMSKLHDSMGADECFRGYRALKKSLDRVVSASSYEDMKDATSVAQKVCDNVKTLVSLAQQYLKAASKAGSMSVTLVVKTIFEQIAKIFRNIWRLLTSPDEINSTCVGVSASGPRLFRLVSLAGPNGCGVLPYHKL